MGYALRRTWLPLRVATLPWNQWQLCRGMSGRFAMESVATFAWNRWQLCRGISGNFRAEYAVKAALTSHYSNGPTEGHVNRLKLFKRQMYGRAKLDLLRQRVLYAA